MFVYRKFEKAGRGFVKKKENSKSIKAPPQVSKESAK